MRAKARSSRRGEPVRYPAAPWQAGKPTVRQCANTGHDRTGYVPVFRLT